MGIEDARIARNVAGMTLHFSKPYNITELLRLLPNIVNWEDAKLVAIACECSVFMSQYRSDIDDIEVVREFHPRSQYPASIDLCMAW